MMKHIKLIIIMIFISLSQFSYAGILLGSTRVVIENGRNEGSVNVHNREDNNYLIQSWVLDKSEVPTDDIALTPPLFKLNANTSNALRIVITKDLPQDRETLYWLNVKFIPSVKKSNLDNNSLSFALNNRIKIIYRPESLSGESINQAFEKIIIKKSGNALKIKNPTKYFINISEISINNKNIKNPGYIEPETEVSLDLPGNNKNGNLEYILIDDLGKLNTFSVII
ncbi:molecular chaperone [Morganella morganii]|uniref:fimbrial biogenesis chaperone n=1 Tax=Morganella morganii TaxID=582 RepID=UPI000D1EBC9D|nr:molecular chaperone [Morganella morganii]HAE79126.1 long polar fimbrial chaperone LpfB [Morganella sp. (in: enterobacteria)]QXO43863.1 molecular chaperone [Morganella morganii]QXO47454.1 molecular chaperone [Morganella morganii]QXO51236.1 molecular chaperone [Morganella morganii]QXO55100.1 molecular chaperone [Morganella morganii]